MSNINRRRFLKTSTGAVCASILGIPLTARPRDYSENSKNAKIYTIFFPTAPSRDDTSFVPETNEEIIQSLKKECAGIDFIVRDVTKKSTTLQSIINEMEDLKKLNFDGVLIFGWPRDYVITRTGLPTINVDIICDFMNIPYSLYRAQGKILSASLDPWRFCASPKVSLAMFKDLVEKIKLIKVLKMMKGSSILTITDSEHVNVIYGDTLKNPPPRYNETILNAIEETFGVNVTKIGTDEVVEDTEIKNLLYNDSKEAEEIAKTWIREAVKMINTIESEIVRSAKVYLAMKILMKKYNTTAIAFHIRTLKKDPRPEERVWPALSTSEFQKHGKVAHCQSHLNIVLTSMLAQYAFDLPSMFGDYSVDTYNNTSMVQHCEGPWNPRGKYDRVPYILTDHRERRIRGRSQPGVGGASWVLYPPDEPVTIWQIDVLSKEILLHTGTTVPILSDCAKYKEHFYTMM